MSNTPTLKEALGRGEGLLRLAPCWVPRSFPAPGGRLRLHPDDLYAAGAHRGGIAERWFASTTRADNGPGTPADEGLSYLVAEGVAAGKRVLLKEGIDELGAEFLGADAMNKHGGWNVLCKFFDYLGQIPHHMHQREQHAKLVGRKEKTEAYYFPPQYNLTPNQFPYTFMGLEPGTGKDDVRRCLERWHQGDNGILHHSRAYKLRLGSGWQVDAGILHAPGSLVTYEPQVNSDVFSCFQSMLDGRALPWDVLVKDVPPEHHHDLDFLIGMLDWEANVDPAFAAHRQFEPELVGAVEGIPEAGYCEKWIAYSPDRYSAKELTVLPGRTVVVKDAAAYGCILVQGFGSAGPFSLSTPTLVRYGDLTEDELFVTASAAQRGITIVNRSSTEPLVMLKHFGPGNPDASPS